jgi:hypothetical protein
MHQQPSTSHNEFPSLSKERSGAKNPKKPKQGKSLSSEFHSAPRSHGNQTREINMEELKELPSDGTELLIDALVPFLELVPVA